MLPPGPSEPSALQTVEWIVRPTTLLRRAQARYGEPFTLRTAWADAPMVLTSDPAEIKRVYAAAPDVLQAGESSSFLEPFTGPKSVLVLSGDEHLAQRKHMLPAFHGQALRSWTETIAQLAEQELDTWPTNTPFAAYPRMQALTLEVIMRIVFGSEDPQLRDAFNRALDLTGSAPKLIAMSLVRRDIGPFGQFLKAMKRIDELVYPAIDDPPPGSMLAMLEGTREERRDQAVTLLAAGRETTASSLAWALERLARHPQPLDSDEQIDATVKEVLRTRPALSITARKTLVPYELGGYTLPPGVYVTPCLYLVHRRAELWPDPTRFEPRRFLNGAQEPFSWIPFGGGTRRCLGAAFATLEMREVLRAVTRRFRLRPDRAEGERMRRRSVTLAPARGAKMLVDPLA